MRNNEKRARRGTRGAECNTPKINQRFHVFYDLHLWISASKPRDRRPRSCQDATRSRDCRSGSRLFQIKPLSIRFVAIWDLSFLGQVKMEARSCVRVHKQKQKGEVTLHSRSIVFLGSVRTIARFTWPFDSCFFGSARRFSSSILPVKGRVTVCISHRRLCLVVSLLMLLRIRPGRGLCTNGARFRKPSDSSGAHHITPLCVSLNFIPTHLRLPPRLACGSARGPCPPPFPAPPSPIPAANELGAESPSTFLALWSSRAAACQLIISPSSGRAVSLWSVPVSV